MWLSGAVRATVIGATFGVLRVYESTGRSRTSGVELDGVRIAPIVFPQPRRHAGWLDKWLALRRRRPRRPRCRVRGRRSRLPPAESRSRSCPFSSGLLVQQQKARDAAAASVANPVPGLSRRSTPGVRRPAAAVAFSVNGARRPGLPSPDRHSGMSRPQRSSSASVDSASRHRARCALGGRRGGCGEPLCVFDGEPAEAALRRHSTKPPSAPARCARFRRPTANHAAGRDST